MSRFLPASRSDLELSMGECSFLTFDLVVRISNLTFIEQGRGRYFYKVSSASKYSGTFQTGYPFWPIGELAGVRMASVKMAGVRMAGMRILSGITLYRPVGEVPLLTEC